MVQITLNIYKILIKVVNTNVTWILNDFGYFLA